MHRWLTGLLLISLIGCTSSSRENGTFSFDKTVPLESSALEVDSVYMRYPFRVRQVDTLLYVTDLHAPSYYCHIFSYPGMGLIRSIAKRGEAPGEFQMVENLRVRDGESVWILDSFKKKISLYDYRADSVSSVVNLHEELIMTLDFAVYDDSLFVVPDYTGENRICIIDTEGGIRKRLFSIPDENIGKDASSKIPYAQAWRPFIDYNRNNGLLAVATQLGQTIELYDLKAGTVINIITGKAGQPVYRIKEGYAVPDGIMGYGDVYVGENNIYALFWGHEFKEIKRGNVKAEGGRYIHVFDLKGNPEVEYVLDSYITGFHIDEKEKKIIGLDVNSNQPVKEFSFR